MGELLLQGFSACEVQMRERFGVWFGNAELMEGVFCPCQMLKAKATTPP